LDEDFYFNELSAVDGLVILNQALFPGTRKRKRRHKRGKQVGSLTRLRRRVNKLPLPSVLLANIQSLENKMNKDRLY
jgi:hypothetical protein